MHLPTKSYSGTMRDISSTWIEYIHNVLWIQPTNPFKKPQAVSTNTQCDEKLSEGAAISYAFINYLFKYQHCNPLQGNYKVELLHWEIPAVITGNEFTEYNFLLFCLHFFPCFNDIEIVALVPIMCTGNCQFILQGLKGCFNTL